jgi:hypothetical protein
VGIALLSSIFLIMKNLPDELVDKILKESTSINGCVELATDGMSYVQLIPLGHVTDNQLEKALQQRLQVINVCKKWHLIGLPHLYAHVRILVSGHRKSSSLKNINPPALVYTCRLTVLLDMAKSLKPTAPIIGQINSLISQMPRLNIVIAPAGIFNAYPPNVNVAMCYSEHRLMNPFVPTWDTLRVLSLDLLSMDSVTHPVDFELNGLHSLHLMLNKFDYTPSLARASPFTRFVAEHLHCPQIRNLGITGSTCGLWEAFLRRHNTLITHLSLEFYGNEPPNTNIHMPSLISLEFADIHLLDYFTFDGIRTFQFHVGGYSEDTPERIAARSQAMDLKNILDILALSLPSPGNVSHVYILGWRSRVEGLHGNPLVISRLTEYNQAGTQVCFEVIQL